MLSSWGISSSRILPLGVLNPISGVRSLSLDSYQGVGLGKSSNEQRIRDKDKFEPTFKLYEAFIILIYKLKMAADVIKRELPNGTGTHV